MSVFFYRSERGAQFGQVLNWTVGVAVFERSDRDGGLGISGRERSGFLRLGGGE